MSKPAGSRLGLLKGEEEHRAAASLLGKRALAGFAGILQVDGYAAYNRLARSGVANEGVTLAACFAQVRRRFYELHVNESSQLADLSDRCAHALALQSLNGLSYTLTLLNLEFCSRPYSD